MVRGSIKTPWTVVPSSMLRRPTGGPVYLVTYLHGQYDHPDTFDRAEDAQAMADVLNAAEPPGQAEIDRAYQ
jgi:hypothetical protein